MTILCMLNSRHAINCQFVIATTTPVASQIKYVTSKCFCWILLVYDRLFSIESFIKVKIDRDSRLI